MSLQPYRSFDASNSWLTDPFFGGLKNYTGTDLTKPFAPLLTMDIVETEDKFKVLADLPGVDGSEIDLTVEKNVLVIKAERKSEHNTDTDTVHHYERSYGCVQRRVQLPRNADMDNAQTSFKNGVLTIIVPKLALAPASRKLAVNTA